MSRSCLPLLVVMFCILLSLPGCSVGQREFNLGGYYDFPNYGHGYVLEYDPKTETAVVELLPDSWVLLTLPNELRTPPEFLGGFPQLKGLRPDDVVDLDCSCLSSPRYEKMRDGLAPGMLVEVDFFLGCDYLGRYECERIELVGSFKVEYRFSRYCARKALESAGCIEGEDSWCRSAICVPNQV